MTPEAQERLDTLAKTAQEFEDFAFSEPRSYIVASRIVPVTVVVRKVHRPYRSILTEGDTKIMNNLIGLLFGAIDWSRVREAGGMRPYLYERVESLEHRKILGFIKVGMRKLDRDRLHAWINRVPDAAWLAMAQAAGSLD